MSKYSKTRSYLKPLAWVFGSIARFRRFLYQKEVFKSYKPNIPVICVGNIAIGGTGKTPHAAFVLNALSQEFKVALLSRGYGRKSKGYILANTTPEDKLSANLIGDEPLLLHRRFPSLPLAVDGDREEGIKKLQEYDPGIQAIVMDDAYQHLSVTPTLRLILTEYARPYFNDYPLPAGRLREFPDAVQDADLVVVTKVDADMQDIHPDEWRSKLGLSEHQPLFFTKYQYAEPEPITQRAQAIALNDESDLVLLTGIANSTPLLQHLQKNFKHIQHISFLDHHNYTATEIENLIQQNFSNKDTEKILFTTEKDWMRLQVDPIKKSVSLLPIFIIPIEVEFLFDNERNTFIKILESHVRRETQKN